MFLLNKKRKLQCVRCRKIIKDGDEPAQVNTTLYTKWGPMHRECGKLLSHVDKYSGKRLPKELELF